MTKVAIITRTLNRAILLKRAAKSIQDQTFTDYCWVIINDGAKEPVNEIVSNFPDDKIIIIHNPSPVGMERATNMGLKASDSDYVVIHDDDDSWHPKFLKKTMRYLDDCEYSDIQKGVITHCDVIKEEIIGDSIKIKERTPFNSWMTDVSLYRILSDNTIPPISFLYRRSVLKEIGYYNENLPVLGDWDFNIRFLLKYEIGLIPEVLAYYHHRNGLYTNSVIGGAKTHQFYDNMLRNDYLRKDIQNGIVGIGFYLNIVRSFENVFHSLNILKQQSDRNANFLLDIYNRLEKISSSIINIESWPNILPSPLKNLLKNVKER